MRGHTCSATLVMAGDNRVVVPEQTPHVTPRTSGGMNEIHLSTSRDNLDLTGLHHLCTSLETSLFTQSCESLSINQYFVVCTRHRILDTLTGVHPFVRLDLT